MFLVLRGEVRALGRVAGCSVWKGFSDATAR